MNELLIIFALFPFSLQEVKDSVFINYQYPKMTELELQKGDSIKITFDQETSFIAIIGDPKFYLSVELIGTSKSYYSTKPGLYALGDEGNAMYTALEGGLHKIFLWTTSFYLCRQVVALGLQNYDGESDIDPSPFAFIETDPNAIMKVESSGLDAGTFAKLYHGEKYELYDTNSGKFSDNIERLVTLSSNDNNWVNVKITSDGDNKFDYGQYSINDLKVIDKPFYYTGQNVKEFMIEGIYNPSDGSTDSNNSGSGDSDSNNSGSGSDKDHDSEKTNFNSESETANSESETETTNYESETETTTTETESNYTESESYTVTSDKDSDSESDDDSKSKSDSDKNNSNSSSNSKLPKGAICGIVIGCIVTAVVIVVIIIIVIKKMKSDYSTDHKFGSDSGMEIEETRSTNGSSKRNLDIDPFNDDPDKSGSHKKDINTQNKPINSNSENLNKNNTNNNLNTRNSQMKPIDSKAENMNGNNRKNNVSQQKTPNSSTKNYTEKLKNDKNSQMNPINSNAENFGENRRKDKNSLKKTINANIENISDNPENDENEDQVFGVNRFGNNRRKDKNSQRRPFDANIENVSDNPENDDENEDQDVGVNGFGNNRRKDKNSQKRPIDANIENVSDNLLNDDDFLPDIEVSNFSGPPQNQAEEPFDIDAVAFD